MTIRKETRDTLEQTLRALPRQDASPDFTERVRHAVRDETANEGVSSLRHLAAAAGVLALVAAAGVAGFLWGPRSSEAPWTAADAPALPAALPSSPAQPVALDLAALDGLPRDQQVRLLRSRMYTLQSELDELRRLANLASPVVHLGGSDSVSEDPLDVLLDVRALVPADRLAVPVSTQGGMP